MKFVPYTKENLKEYREKAHLSQIDMASRCGICRKMYQKLEYGTAKPKSDLLGFLGLAVGVHFYALHPEKEQIKQIQKGKP